MGLKADMSAMGRGAKREPGAKLRRRRQPPELLEHDLGCGRRGTAGHGGTRHSAGSGVTELQVERVWHWRVLGWSLWCGGGAAVARRQTALTGHTYPPPLPRRT